MARREISSKLASIHRQPSHADRLSKKSVRGKRAARLFLFQDRDTDIYAISLEPTGANLPRLDAETSWCLLDVIADLGGMEVWNKAEFEMALFDLTVCGYHVFDGELIPYQ